MSSIVNQISYLRTTRSFPIDPKDLSAELSKTYVDIANTVNTRSIGIYALGKQSITGNAYFFTSAKQQSLRQVYQFTATTDIDIGFKISSAFQFIQFYGTYTSGTAIFGLIPATSVAIAGQISFHVDVNGASTTSDVIKFVLGAGAPALTQGTIVIEWIANT